MKWRNSTEFCFVFSSFVGKDEDMDEEVFYLEYPFGFAINVVLVMKKDLKDSLPTIMQRSCRYILVNMRSIYEQFCFKDNRWST